MESSRTRDRTRIPCIGRWILNPWTTRKALVVRFYLNSLLSPWLAFLLQGWLHYALIVVSCLHDLLLSPLPSSPVLLPSLFTSSTYSYPRSFAHALPSTVRLFLRVHTAHSLLPSYATSQKGFPDHTPSPIEKKALILFPYFSIHGTCYTLILCIFSPVIKVPGK